MKSITKVNYGYKEVPLFTHAIFFAPSLNEKSSSFSNSLILRRNSICENDRRI